MARFPVESDQARDEQFGSFFAGAGFAEGLVEEEGVAHGAVDGAVEDVGECFSLFFSISFALYTEYGVD